MKNMSLPDRACALKRALESRHENLRVGVVERFGGGRLHLRLHGYDPDIQLPVRLTLYEDGSIALEYTIHLEVPRDQLDEMYESLNQINSLTILGTGCCYVYGWNSLSFHGRFWADGSAEDAASHICDALQTLSFTIFTLECAFGDGVHRPHFPDPDEREYFSVTALRLAMEAADDKKC